MIPSNKQIGVGSVKISKRAKKYLHEVIRSNRLSYGPFSERFEQALAQAHDSSYGVFVNSGTSALQIAVAALKERYQWNDGDEIIVPALTFVASSNVILKNNLTPVFVDVDARHYNIDPHTIEGAITPKTKAIMVVHLFGQPADMDPLMALAKRHNLRVIEDSCETMFARYKGKSVGSFGDISCFSTYACHIICTGVGGLAVTSNRELAVLLRSLANHGRDAIYFSMDHDATDDPQKLKMIMEKRFSFIRLGYSYRATEMEAALGLAQLEEIDKNIPKRRKNAQVLLQGLQKWEQYLQLPALLPGAEHSFMMFPLVIKTPSIKKQELTFFLEQRNIETRDMLPLTNQPYKKKLFGEELEERFPIAKYINQHGFYIGCHPELTRRDLQYVLGVFDAFFAQYNQQKREYSAREIVI
ncbi:MAG: DegT/DnrJ/EryC1/StrS family aminotransferase [Nanoarchaeota archaeon]|nr:DegT/DnrJ/EryC1/StrS family aminotransferase [Nanoarchaeota archaeon]